MINQKLVVFNRNGNVYSFDYDGTNKTDIGNCSTVAGDAAVDMNRGFIYLVESGSKIVRFTLDGYGSAGGAGETVVSRTGIYYVAIDEINEKLYYAVYTSGVSWTVRSCNLDGSSDVEILNSTTDAFTNCWGLVVSTVERKLFFTDQGGQDIRKCDLDGDNLTLVVANLGYSPSRITLDPHSRLLFWCDASNGKIYSVSTGGGTPTAVVTGLGGGCNDLAFNEEDGYLYFTRHETLRRVKRDGTGLTTLNTATTGQYYYGVVPVRKCVPWRPVHVMSAIGDKWACKEDGSWLQMEDASLSSGDGLYGSRHHVDYTNGYVYYWDNGAIKRCDLDGTNVTTIKSPPSGWDLHGGMVVDTTDNFIFYGCWVDGTSSVQTRRCSTSGASDTQISSTMCLGCGDYDPVNNKLYMALYGSSTIYEMSYTGANALAWNTGNSRYNTMYCMKVNGMHYKDGYLYLTTQYDIRYGSAYTPAEYVYKLAVNGTTTVSSCAWASVPDLSNSWYNDNNLSVDPDGNLLVCGYDSTAQVGLVYKVVFSTAAVEEWIRGVNTRVTGGGIVVQTDEEDPAKGMIYCVDITDNEIVRSTPPNLTDETVVTILEHYGTVGDVLCANDWLVWSDITTNSIIRAKCDGTVIQSVWDDLDGMPLYIAYDEGNDVIYWTEYGGTPTYRIMKGNADGSGSKTEVCNSTDDTFNNCWGLAYMSGLGSYPLVIADTSHNKLWKTNGSTFVTLKAMLNSKDPKKIAVDKQSTAAACQVFYGYNSDTIRAVDGDGTDDAQLCDINRMPTMLTYNPDDDYVYILKTSSQIAKVKDDGTGYNSSLKTYADHDIRGVAYNPE